MNKVSENKAVKEAGVSSLVQKKKDRHPADVAGVTRHTFFKTDLWIIGGKEFVTAKNTVPQRLEGAFLPSKPSDPKEISMHFNPELFEVERLTGIEKDREYLAWIDDKATGKGIVEVTLRDDTFVVRLFSGAHDKKFPFTKEDFLRALHAGKVDVELDQLGDGSDSEEEV